MKGRETAEKHKVCLFAIWKQSTLKKVQVTCLTSSKALPVPTRLPTLTQIERTEGKKVVFFFIIHKKKQELQKEVIF